MKKNNNIPVFRSRAPRFFLVSSTTSVLSTTTMCWFSGTAAISTTCSGRKKRSILSQPVEEDVERKEISPSLIADEIIDGIEDVESGMKESERDGRFLLYWATTTSTTTSFTSTSTIATLNCTPANYAVSQCG